MYTVLTSGDLHIRYAINVVYDFIVILIIIRMGKGCRDRGRKSPKIELYPELSFVLVLAWEILGFLEDDFHWVTLSSIT